MARRIGPAFLVVEIVGEFRAGLLLAVDQFGAQHGLVAHVGAQAADQIGVDRNRLGDDVARAFERGLHVGDFAGDIGGREFARISRAIGKDRVGERLQTALARDFGLGAALRLVRQVKVFELGFGERGMELLFQPLAELTLRADRLEDGVAAAVELAQVDEPFGERAQLRVVEAAGRLLAVARDERHRRAFVDQLHRGFHLIGPGVDLGPDQSRDALVVFGHHFPRLVTNRGGEHNEGRTGKPSSARGGFRG